MNEIDVGSNHASDHSRVTRTQVGQLGRNEAGAPWRIPDHRIKTAGLHNFRETILVSPIEDIDPVFLIVGQQWKFGLLVKIRTDEGVSAFDVIAQLRQGALVEKGE